MTIWMGAFAATSKLARKPRLDGVTRRLMRCFAWQSLLLKHGQRKSSLKDVVLEWQRMFPSPQINHITSIEPETAYAEVRIQCPLKGTGDVQACERLMEYDRTMLRKIGGQLIVLRSQAEPGVEFCKVAIRLHGANTDDLQPAHQRFK